MLLEAQETISLIGSDKVQGTAVFGPDGEIAARAKKSTDPMVKRSDRLSG